MECLFHRNPSLALLPIMMEMFLTLPPSRRTFGSSLMKVPSIVGTNGNSFDIFPWADKISLDDLFCRQSRVVSGYNKLKSHFSRFESFSTQRNELHKFAKLITFLSRLTCSFEGLLHWNGSPGRWGPCGLEDCPVKQLSRAWRHHVKWNAE